MENFILFFINELLNYFFMFGLIIFIFEYLEEFYVIVLCIVLVVVFVVGIIGNVLVFFLIIKFENL